MPSPKAALFWSGGKDSALALDRIRRRGDYEICALVTTINPEFGRISMHGVRETLAKAQAEAADVAFVPMYVASASTNEVYVDAFRQTLAKLCAAGVRSIVFGDIFLADLRQWREGLLRDCGAQGVFPLWGENTRGLAREFVERRFDGVVCCVDDAHLGEADVGARLDDAFFQGLSPTVDPCGENGEYHSFVGAGPIFSRPIRYRLGDKVYRPLGAGIETGDVGGDASFGAPAAPAPTATRGFWFVDLLADD
jgi:uncharacterized protein (TIGR00290 family)